MMQLLPIIEQLAEAPSDSRRADWLLACPLGVLAKYQMTIRNRLRVAGFLAGVDYVDRVLPALSMVRDSESRDLWRVLVDAGDRLLHAVDDAADQVGPEEPYR